MYRFKHGWELFLGVQVCSGRQTHSAGDRRTQVCKNISKQVRRNDDLESFRILYHKHSRGVYQQGMCFYLRIAFAYFFEDLIPEYHGEIKCITFGYAGQRFILLFGQFICISYNSFRPLPGKHTVLDYDLLRRILVKPGPLPAIFPFAVFPDKKHVNFARIDPFERA